MPTAGWPGWPAWLDDNYKNRVEQKKKGEERKKYNNKKMMFCERRAGNKLKLASQHSQPGQASQASNGWRVVPTNYNEELL